MALSNFSRTAPGGRALSSASRRPRPRTAGSRANCTNESGTPSTSRRRGAARFVDELHHQVGAQGRRQSGDRGQRGVAAAIFEICDVRHGKPGVRGHGRDGATGGNAPVPQQPAELGYLHRTHLAIDFSHGIVCGAMWQTLAHHPTFRRLWIAATIDSFGSWLLTIAVPVHIYSLTGSATSTSLALAIQALPAVLIGPWAGVVVDRFSRRTVLVLANLACAAGIALMLTPGGVAYLYLGLAIESLAECFLRPAFQAAVPMVVAEETTLASANALLALSNSTWRICGPLIGTALTAIGLFPSSCCSTSPPMLIAAAIIRTLPIRRAPAGARVDHQLRQGLRHVARTPTLRGLLASSWLYWTANAGLTALLVPFATQRLHASGSAVGYLITGLGVGYLCGSALSRRILLHFPARTIVAFAYTTVGFCFLVMFTTTSLPVAIAAATAAGVPGAAALVATTHQLQLSTPDSVRGRVSAAFHTSDAIAAVAGALAAPALVALAGLAYGLLLLSAAVLAAAALAALTLPGTAPAG